MLPILAFTPAFFLIHLPIDPLRSSDDLWQYSTTSGLMQLKSVSRCPRNRFDFLSLHDRSNSFQILYRSNPRRFASAQLSLSVSSRQDQFLMITNLIFRHRCSFGAHTLINRCFASGPIFCKCGVLVQVFRFTRSATFRQVVPVVKHSLQSLVFFDTISSESDTDAVSSFAFSPVARQQMVKSGRLCDWATAGKAVLHRKRHNRNCRKRQIVEI